MTSRFFALSGFFFLLLLISCSKDDSSTSTIDCTGLTPKYSTDIAPIINSSCAQGGCHDSGTRAGGYNLSSYANVVAGTKNSNFLKSIKHEGGVEKMPQGSAKLADDVIKKIQCWIQNGTPQ